MLHLPDFTHSLRPVGTGVNRVWQGSCGGVKQGSHWVWQQPGTQWVVDQYIKAGEREMSARNALSDQFGTAWKHVFNVGHQQVATFSRALPEQNRLLQPLKRSTHRFSQKLKHWSDNLSDKALWRKMIGSFTFKGITDGVYFLGGGKALLVGLHFMPGPGQIIAPFTLLSLLSAGAMATPALKKARQQFKDISPEQLQAMQQRIAQAQAARLKQLK